MTFKQFFKHYEFHLQADGIDRPVLKLSAEEAAQIAGQAFKQLIEHVRLLEAKIKIYEGEKNANPST